jgi:bifunctional enzyme CysN/CysC
MSAITQASRNDLAPYLEQQQRKQLLRFITCGSVDDG